VSIVDEPNVSTPREGGLAVSSDVSGTFEVRALGSPGVWMQARLSNHLVRFRNIAGHSGTWALLDQVFVSLTNFSTGILIGRFCSKDELGRYMLGYSVILFAIAFQQMLISSPYILIQPRLLEGEGHATRLVPILSSWRWVAPYFSYCCWRRWGLVSLTRGSPCHVHACIRLPALSF